MTLLRKYLISRSFSAFAQEHCFVPQSKPVNKHDIDRLKEFIQNANRITVLTGAGISTESGIPDYRSKGVGLYARSQRRPIQYQQFIRSQEVRRRYWIRNFVAWPQFSSHKPNDSHITITKMQKKSIVDTVVTMNVDNLHRKAGASPLIELHGCAYKVVCLSCGESRDRHKLQTILSELNPNLKDLHLNQDVVRPDGDIDVPQECEHGFIVAKCDKCGGDLMPDVVFFGDNVPLKRVQAVEECFDRTSALLILGSSVSTYSAYRICLRAAKTNKPIAMVNIGETRADNIASLKIEAKCGDVVPQLCS